MQMPNVSPLQGKVMASSVCATRQWRIDLLVRALGCDAAKAAPMADRLSGLTDEAFRAQAEYLARQLAGYLKATHRR
jgi:hypothetical protein